LRIFAIFSHKYNHSPHATILVDFFFDLSSNVDTIEWIETSINKTSRAQKSSSGISPSSSALLSLIIAPVSTKADYWAEVAHRVEVGM
jgi:hypothetical protein